MSKPNTPTYDDIKKATELLKNAKVPTEDRHGYMVMDDGSVKMFGSIRDEYVPVVDEIAKLKEES